MTGERQQLSQEKAEILQRNLDQARELLARKHERSHEAPPAENQRPPEDDSRPLGNAGAPNQEDVPVGGTSGGEMNRGGGFKSGRG